MSSSLATHRLPDGSLYRRGSHGWEKWISAGNGWENVLIPAQVVLGLRPYTVEVDKGSKYKHPIKGDGGCTVDVDIYDVLRAWNITDPAHAHGLKKILQPGSR